MARHPAGMGAVTGIAKVTAGGGAATEAAAPTLGLGGPGIPGGAAGGAPGGGGFVISLAGLAWK